MKCRGTIRNGPKKGQPCGRSALAGGFVCAAHGGGAPQVKAKALVRFELQSWGIDENMQLEDPGEVLMRLLAQSYGRARLYAAAIEDKYQQVGGLEEAMVGDNLVLNPNTGSLVKVGEYIRGLATLEAQERDRAAKFAALAIQAGLAERVVRVQERQAAQMADALLAAFGRMQLNPEQVALMPAVLAEVLAISS